MSTISVTGWEQGFWESKIAATTQFARTNISSSLGNLDVYSVEYESDSYVKLGLVGGGYFSFKGSGFTSSNTQDVSISRITIDKGSSLYVRMDGDLSLEGDLGFSGFISYALYKDENLYDEDFGNTYVSYSGNISSYLTLSKGEVYSQDLKYRFEGDGQGNWSKISLQSEGQEFLANGTWNIDQLSFEDSSDVFDVLLSESDYINGSSNDDFFSGRKGNDVLDGKEGTDTAVYLYEKDYYDVSFYNGAFTVVSLNDYRDEGVDKLINVENIQFNDEMLTLPRVEFDALSYIASYDDLIENIGDNADIGYEHYIYSGAKEGRGVTFSAEQYLANYPDLEIALNNDLNAAKQHYITSGYFENRSFAVLESSTKNNLVGTIGDDVFYGDFGEQYVYGGSGIDTIILNGQYSNFVFDTTDNFLKINGDGRLNYLDGIERVKFEDKNIAFDLDGNAGITVKVVGAAFGADSILNQVYVGIGLNLLDNGMSYDTLMGLAFNAAGATTNEAVVDTLWENLFGAARTGTQGDDYVGMLDDGVLTKSQFGVIAADHSLNTTNIDLAGLAQTGIEYTLIA